VLVDPTTCQVTALVDSGRLLREEPADPVVGTADPYGDIALHLATARETWSDKAMARRADQKFAELYGTELDAEREEFHLRLGPLTW